MKEQHQIIQAIEGRPIEVRLALHGVEPGPAPMLKWVKIADLVVDDSYQRDLKPGNWKAIKAIASDFKWSRFSPVFVAPVEGGKFAIIDGQHRTHAAAMCGFAEVPCQIVQMSREEQAAAFAAVNGLVTKVTTWQIFKAAHASGAQWAVEMQRVAHDAGCRVMTANASMFSKKPGEIYSVVKLRKIIDQHKAENVTKALGILRQAEGFKDDAEYWDGSIIIPMIEALCERPPVLNNPAASSAVSDFDVFGAIDKIRQEVRQRRVRGQPFMGVAEAFRAAFLAFLDRKMPARMALPGGVKAMALAAPQNSSV